MEKINKDNNETFKFYNHPIMGEGFILDWLVLGLFTTPIEREYDAIPPEQKDNLISVGGENRIFPFEGMKVKWQDREFIWSRHHLLNPYSGIFDSQFTTEFFPKWGYLATYLKSSDEREVFFWIKARDGYLLWLNHRMLGAYREIPRGAQAVYKVKLKKGLNLILAKIWCFRAVPTIFFRVTDEKERSLKGVEIKLEGPKIQTKVILEEGLKKEKRRKKVEKTLRVPFSPTPLSLKTLTNDKIWEKCSCITSFINKEGYLAKQQTCVQALYDERYLYFRIKLGEEHMESLRGERSLEDELVWQKDHFNIFLDTSHDHQNYYHFLINEAGEIFDRKRFNFLWDSKNTECQIKRSKNSWMIYLAIPFADLNLNMPQNGEVWGVNFSRSEAPSGEGETFWLNSENPAEFGELIFGKSSLEVVSLNLGEPENRRNLLKTEIENKREEKVVKYRIRISSRKEEIFFGEGKVEFKAREKKILQIPYAAYYPGVYQLEFSLWEESGKKCLYRALYPFKEGTSLLLRHTDFKGGLLNEMPLTNIGPGKCKVLYSKKTGYDKMEVSFILDREPSCDKVILLNCWGVKALVQIFINKNKVWEKTLIEGESPYSKTGKKIGFTPQTIIVNKSFLRKGENSIIIQNCEKEGQLGVAPLFALKSLRLIIAEEGVFESKDDLRITKVRAERFNGEKTLLPLKEPPYSHNYSLKRLRQTVTIPETGEIKASFLLERGPVDNEKEKSYYLLYLHRLWMYLPWVKSSPEADPEKELSHFIQINGHTINNFCRKEGYITGGEGTRSKKFKVPFKITIPASYLRKGVNKLSFKRTSLPSLSSWEDRQLEYFTLVEKKIKDPHLLAVPRVVRAGDTFYLKLELLRTHQVNKIETPEGVKFIGNLPLRLNKGVHKLYFKALKPLDKSSLTLINDRGRFNFKVPRVINVPDEGIKHVILTLVGNDPDIYENHVKEIESLRDLDLGNTMHQRVHFSSHISPEFARKVAQLYRKNRMYMSYSWRAIETKGVDTRDGWTPSRKFKPLVTENDLKEWAGKYFFYGGSARIEPEVHFYKNLQEVKDAYLKRMRIFYKENPTFACHINQVWHRYGMEAGAIFPWVQLNYSNSEIINSSMRGASRAYGNPGFGVTGCDDCAIAYTADERYMRMSAIHNWITYLSGAIKFMPEISNRWALSHRFLPFHRYFDDYFEREVDKGRLSIEKDFYDYIRTHRRGKGPLTYLAFIQGNLEAWHGWDGWDGKHNFYEGYYRPEVYLWFREEDIIEGRVPKWRFGPAEAGWRYMRKVFSHLKFIMSYPLIHPTDRKFYFCGTPYGKVDITPIEASLKSLKRYRALVFLGWNTADENQYEKLKAYVDQGGILLMSLPQLSTHIERGADLKFVKEGNFEDLFGVKILGKGKEIKEIKFLKDTNLKRIKFPVGKIYPLIGHKRNVICCAFLKNFSAQVLAEADGEPVLLEKKVGKGYAYLLSLWNYPGEEKLTCFMEDIVSSIAQGVQSSVRVTGNDNINFGIFLDKGDSGQEGEVVTRIFLADIDWWSVEKKESYARLHLKDKAFLLTLPRAEIKKVVYFKKIAISAQDKMVHIETINESNSSYIIPVQGGGSHSFELFLLEGRVNKIKINGKEVEYKEDRKNRVVFFQIQLSGRDILSINLR